MDNEKTKSRGRPPKYNSEMERKNAIRESKRKYMVNKEWICIVCDNHNYSLSGKFKHLNSKKHKDAVNRINMNKISNIIHKK